MNLKHSLVAVALTAVAAAAVAQPAPPPTERPAMPAGPRGEDPHMVVKRFMHGPWDGLTAAGRDIMRVASQPPADHEQRRERERALDARAAELLAAERLDVAALRRVMTEKAQLRAAADSDRQQRLLDAYQRLSAADRKTLAENMKNRNERFDHIMSMHGDRIRALREHRRRLPAPPVEPGTKL